MPISQWTSEELQHAQVIVLDREFKMPFENAYKTPETLGLDRLALVAAATQQFPNKDTLIIDAERITHDFVTAKAQYLGGAISPDYKCGTKPHKIPPNFRYWNHGIDLLHWNNKEMSMHSGVVNGIHEIQG